MAKNKGSGRPLAPRKENKFQNSDKTGLKPDT